MVASIALVATATWLWGAKEVRGNAGEVVFLTAWGVFWIIVAQRLFFWLGLSVRDDAVDGKNPAALVALGSATLAVAIIYAAGNLGEGPSYWENLFSAGIGTAGLLALWLFLEIGARVSLSIAEERDLASGIRFGGFLLAAGSIIGRAVAGDWHSVPDTVHDCWRDGWPAALLWVIAFIIELFARPKRTHPFPNWFMCGLLPGLGYLTFAAAWVYHLGRWEGMPR